ncbi:MAG: HNH endonuclease family protein [Microbacteriaceae bacterium]
MSRSTRRRRGAVLPAALVGAIALVVLLATQLGGIELGGSSQAPAASGPVAIAPAEPSGLTAVEALAALEVKGPAPATGYDREGGFGTAWLDVDRNGCGTRDDVLARDLTGIDAPGGCRVLSGDLLDPYTGESIAFVRGQDTSTAVQIDHLVALQNAWRTGAQQLSQEDRVALANDPLNLLAVDGPTNSAKGAGDAATWLPPAKGIRCEYVARQVSVKAAYGLWVVPAERDAIARVLEACPEQPAYRSSLAY